MNLPNLKAISVEGFYPEILGPARPRMTFGQWCWTSQPLLCRHVLEKENQDHVIYMDSDCYFFDSPRPLFKEIEKHGAEITIVPHRFPPELKYLEPRSGIYCTHFNFFKKGSEADKVLRFWQQECLKYDQSNAFQYPGQKCLDEWKSLSAKTLILEDFRAGMAPWNIKQYEEPPPLAQPAVFYHFHALYFLSPSGYDLGHYTLPRWSLSRIYQPYLNHLQKLLSRLKEVAPDQTFIRRNPRPATLTDVVMRPSLKQMKNYYVNFKRRMAGTWNVFASVPGSATSEEL